MYQFHAFSKVFLCGRGEERVKRVKEGESVPV